MKMIIDLDQGLVEDIKKYDFDFARGTVRNFQATIADAIINSVPLSEEPEKPDTINIESIKKEAYEEGLEDAKEMIMDLCKKTHTEIKKALGGLDRIDVFDFDDIMEDCSMPKLIDRYQAHSSVHKHNKIWKQIKAYVKNNGYTDLTEHGLNERKSDGTYELYGEDMFSSDDYLYIKPIEKVGKDTYGIVNIDINKTNSTLRYTTFEEFMQILEENYWNEIGKVNHNTLETETER